MLPECYKKQFSLTPDLSNIIFIKWRKNRYNRENESAASGDSWLREESEVSKMMPYQSTESQPLKKKKKMYLPYFQWHMKKRLRQSYWDEYNHEEVLSYESDPLEW